MGTMLIPKTAGCGVLGDWAKNNGQFISWTGTPQPGDLVLFDFSGKHASRDHVGTLLSISGNVLTTIEGNTSVTSNDNGGAVMIRTRYKSQVVGYVRPKWTSAQTAAKFLAIARAEVGVTEYPSGSNKVKYNTWYYGSAVSGSAYPWCLVFQVWCFAVLAGEISTGKDYGTEEKTVTVTLKQLQRGSTGGQVKTLQRLLNAAAEDGAFELDTVLDIDGSFGAMTEAAVQAYKDAIWPSYAPNNGVVGKETWEKLIN